MDKPQGPGISRICIIGAGLTGLAAGYRLASEGHAVTLVESAPDAGGMIASFRLGSERIEYIYHHVFTSDTDMIQLSAELGLAGRIRWYRTREAIFCGRRLYPFSTPIDLLRYRPIPFLQRLKTGLAVLKAGRLRDYLAMENMTASEWLDRESGTQACRRLWQPLLRSKFDQDADAVSAVWIWNKFRLRGSSRGRGGNSRLGYMQGSFGLVADALEQGILAKGGQILYNHTAMNIARLPGPGGDTYCVSCVLGSTSSVRIAADAVIATISGRQFANVSAGLGLPDAYMSKVRTLRYKGDLCLILRLKESLSPYYWTTICDESPFVVVVEHTSLTGPEPYGGHVVYLSRYLDAADPLWNKPDGEVYAAFAEGLSRIYPAFSKEQVIDWRLRRIRYAQPVIVCGYSQRMPAMDTPAAGVKLAGMAQIYPEDRGMNYAVRLGEEAAGAVRRHLEERQSHAEET